jgi:hypothetical protein
MDDYHGGAATEEAVQLRSERTKFMHVGGFHITQWCSNSEKTLHSIPVPDRATASLLTLSEDDTVKALGLQWEPNTDLFRYSVMVYSLGNSPALRSFGSRGSGHH